MPQHRTLFATTVALSTAMLVQPGAAQELSSSLYHHGAAYSDPFADAFDPFAPTAPGRQTDRRQLSPAIAAISYSAVLAPAPRLFAINDLVTVVIHENMTTDFTSSLETEKTAERRGEIVEFPRLTLSDLLDARISPSEFADGEIALDLEYEQAYEGEGDYSNQQTMTGRIQARVIDVKPNGTLVLEARKSVTSDHEHYQLVATGTCRVDDITADNTILSSQLANLYIDKQHQGHLKQAADKGLLTNILDFIFNF